MELRKILAALFAVGVVLLLIFISLSQQPREIYSETATVVRKSWDFVEKEYVIKVSSNGRIFWKRISRGSSIPVVRVYKIMASRGSEYEIVHKADWDMIKENDVIKQFVRAHSKVMCLYDGQVIGTPCYIEVWRNGNYLGDIEAYNLVD